MAKAKRYHGEEATIIPAKEVAAMRAKWDAMTPADFAACEEEAPKTVRATVR